MLRHTSLPTEEDIRSLHAGEGEYESRSSATGTILIIILPFVFLIYRAHDPLLGLVLTALLAFVATKVILRWRRA